MEILFKTNIEGVNEMKSLLGFVNGDYKIKNLVTDIEQASYDLIHLIGQDMYDKLIKNYTLSEPSDTATDEEKEVYAKAKNLVKLAQIPVLSFALMAYENNLDVDHSGSGRPSSTKSDQKAAWQWQQEKDESATRRRAYKALDMLIDALDASEEKVWLESNEYKESKEHFINTTRDFQRIWPIFNSRQLLLRLHPFMDEAESDHILPIIGQEKFTALQEASLDPAKLTGDLIPLMKAVKKPIAYCALADAYTVLPVEMFPDNVVQYSETTSIEATARHEKIQYFRYKFNRYIEKLRSIVKTSNEDNTPIEVLPEFEKKDKYASI